MQLSSFSELSVNEMQAINAGGWFTLFLGFVGLSISPAVACLAPTAGLELAGTSIYVIADNWPSK